MAIARQQPAESAASPLASRLAVLLFTDVVGSTELKTRIGTAGYSRLIARHDELFKSMLKQEAGAAIVQDTGDGYFATFATTSSAVRLALRFQHALRCEPWGDVTLTVRVGLHVGEVGQVQQQADQAPKLVGLAPDLAARVMGLGNGGQILMTRAAFDEAREFVGEHPPADRPLTLKWVAHGAYLFKGCDEPIDVFEVGAEGLAPLIPPPSNEKARRIVAHVQEETLGWRPAVGMSVPQRAGWTLMRKLGEGGFGEVWLGQQQRTRQYRVFKFCFDADRLRSFKRELTLFRLLRDALGDREDIARLYDVKLDESPFMLESEYSPSGNLADWAAKQGGLENIPLEQRLTTVARVIDAVAAAHSVGILHKDIKPSNILVHVREDGAVIPRLCDFGIGMLTDFSQLRARHITETGLTLVADNDSSRTGTRMYAPPELLAGQPFSMHGDIYALGVLLYQVAVADLDRPLAAGWERDVEDELLKEDIACAIDGEPSRRFSSASAMAQRLRDLDSRRRQLQARNDARRTAERRRRLLRLSMAACGVLVVLLLLLLAVHLSLRTKVLRQAGEMAQRFEKELDIGDWSERRLLATEDLLRTWSQIAPADAEAARPRLVRAYADYVEKEVHRSHLEDEDVKRIEQDIRLLSARDETLAASLSNSLQSRLQTWNPVVDLQAPFERMEEVLARGSMVRAGSAIRLSSPQDLWPMGQTYCTDIECGTTSTVELTLSPKWEDVPGPIGVAMVQDDPGKWTVDGPSAGYSLRVDYRCVDSDGRTLPPNLRTMSQARKPGGWMVISIGRGSTVLRSRHVVAGSIPSGPLRLGLKRDGGRLVAQVNDLPSLQAFDAMPLEPRETSHLGLKLSRLHEISRLRILRPVLPAAPSPLQMGDSLFARGAYEQAMRAYEAMANATSVADVRQEARFKQAACLAKLRRNEEAVRVLEPLSAEGGLRWPASAACQIWWLYREMNRPTDADAAMDMMMSRFNMDQLGAAIPDDMRQALVDFSMRKLIGFNRLTKPDAEDVKRLRRMMSAEDPFALLPEQRSHAQQYVVGAMESLGDLDGAARLLEQLLDEPPAQIGFTATIDLQREYGALMRIRGEPARALTRLEKSMLDADGSVKLFHQALRIERARLLHFMGRSADAEQELETFLAAPGAPGSQPSDLALAYMALGFIREGKGDAAGAKQAWESGLLRVQGKSKLIEDIWGVRPTVLALALISLSETGSDDEIEQVIEKATNGTTTANTGSLSVLQNSMRSVAIRPAAVRKLCQGARGHDWARRYALGLSPASELIREAATLAVYRIMEDGCSVGVPSREQEQALWDGVTQALEAHSSGRIGAPQLLQLAMAWKGTNNVLGWSGVAPSLQPPLRAALAYALGMHQIKANRMETAQELLRQAAAATNDAPAIARLAHEELDHRSWRVGPTMPAAE